MKNKVTSADLATAYESIKSAKRRTNVNSQIDLIFWAQLLAQYIYEEIKPVDLTGCTVKPSDGSKPNFSSNTYISSILGAEKTFKGWPTEEEIYLWVLAHAKKLLRRGHYIGGWLEADTGIFYLDVSRAIKGRPHALIFADENKQAFIYHPAAGKPINVREALAPIAA